MIHDLFSKRQRRLRGETPDFYQYDILPLDLKKQSGMLIEETLGNSERENRWMAIQVYDFILGVIAKEWARPELLSDGSDPHPERA